MTTYFFDRTFSPRLPQALAALGVATIAHRDRFPPDTEDAIWLPQLQGTEYVIITGDTRIRRKRAEAAALASTGLTTLFLFPQFSNWGMWRQAAWLVTYWPKIDLFVQRTQQGTLARVTQGGNMEVFTIRPLV
jgi:hypothetical protein